ncbi:dynamin family protein [Frankia sp. CcWB3]
MSGAVDSDVFNRLVDRLAAENPGPDGGASDELADLFAVVRRVVLRRDEPMRVAVVGRIKAGKSTAVNALLGYEAAATGRLELTFNVQEMHYSDVPAMIVHRRDGRRERHPVELLERLTTRDGTPDELLADIRKVEVGLPIPMLRRFRLVDTPGLGSVHHTDSANTLAALGIADPAEQAVAERVLAASGGDARRVHAESMVELDRADAIVYLFSRALSDEGRAAVVDFLGEAAAAVTPIRAFGVLTRCDQYWPPPPGPDRDLLGFDPMAAAGVVAARYAADPGLRRLFHSVLPVAGLAAAGAQTLPDDAFAVLADLAAIEPPRLARVLADADRFTAPSCPGIDVPQQARQWVHGRLGGWGVLLAARYLRDGLGPEALRAQLVRDSGVAQLRRVLTGHFGNRADLIRMDGGLRDVDAVLVRTRTRVVRAGRLVPEMVEDLAEELERARAEEPAFHELDLLAAHYRGDLDLTAAEAEEVLRVTGEHGRGCADRLGLPAAATPAELVAAAERRVQVWARRQADPTLDAATQGAARTLLGCYSRLRQRAADAADLIARARALLAYDEHADGETADDSEMAENEGTGKR